MSRNILNQDRVFINTLTGGDAINISSTNSTSSSCNLKISKQTANTSIANTDLFVLEDSSGNIRKITGANMKSELEQSTVVEPLLLTGNAISIKGLSGFTANKILKVNSAGDSIEYADDNNTEYTAGTNLLLSVGNEFSLNSTISNNITFNGTPTINNFIEVKGQSGQIGYINFYDIGTTNNISLIPPTNISGGSYNITLPSSVGTIALTTGDITGNASTATKILSITNSNIVQLTTTQTLTNKTITGNFTGGLTGNADTSTKIASITNSNIVQLTDIQVLSNKTFNDLTIFNTGLAVKQPASNTSGNVRFYDDNDSHFIDLHIQNETVASDLNLFLPNDIDNSVLVGTINTQTLTNKTLSSTTNTITQYTGNSSAVITTPSATGTLLTNQDTIPVNKGGTNITTYTIGDILYASGTTTLSKLAIGSANRFLMSNGSSLVWGLGYSVATPLIFTGLDISINGLNGYGSNNQIIKTTGSALAYTSTLTSIALSSCSGNISQFTNDSSYLTSITTPLTTATNFGTNSTGSVSIGKSNQNLNLIANGIYLDYTVPFTIGIVSEFIASSLISYDASITSMVFGEKGSSGYNSAIHSDTVLNLSLTNSAYDITMSSTAGDITYTAPSHSFSGVIKTFGSSISVGEDNSTGNLEVAINHSTSSSVGSSFVVFYYDSSSNPQIGDIGQVGTSSVAFNETSDYRLKTEIEDFNNNLSIINKLKVRKYKFISDVNAGIDLPFIGFIAHECNEASEYFDTVVSGKKDETAMWCKKCNSFSCKCGDDCGEMIMKNKYQAIDYGKFTPYTVGAIQELYAIIQQQQTVINNLLSSSSFKEFKSK